MKNQLAGMIVKVSSSQKVVELRRESEQYQMMGEYLILGHWMRMIQREILKLKFLLMKN